MAPISTSEAAQNLNCTSELWNRRLRSLNYVSGLFIARVVAEAWIGIPKLRIIAGQTENGLMETMEEIGAEPIACSM